jgi:hypothetical protein
MTAAVGEPIATIPIPSASAGRCEDIFARDAKIGRSGESNFR